MNKKMAVIKAISSWSNRVMVLSIFGKTTSGSMIDIRIFATSIIQNMVVLFT